MSIKNIYRGNNVRIRMLVNKIENVKAHLVACDGVQEGSVGLVENSEALAVKFFEGSKGN
jgi:hypothetical protein